MRGKEKWRDGPLPSYKTIEGNYCRVSPNFLSISLSFLSINQLQYLQEEIPKQIARHLRGRLPPSSCENPNPPPLIDSDWIGIG
mmetsp:Transcript_10016/g.16208  ORF Transcript_10016/g.16208 Transcript_10016/m.16208 type:complete len:84 (+) Transcript_10016:21-272(+)